MKKILKTETLQKQTRKRYPNCKSVTDEYGLWYIIDNNSEDIFVEFMIPHQPSERLAWEMGKFTAQTAQNFNRSHPLKVDIQVEDPEIRTWRIGKRKEGKLF